MRKFLSLLLCAALAFPAFGATVNGGNATMDCALRNGDSYEKVLFKVPLPDLAGGTCTAATLHCVVNAVDGSGVSVDAYVSEDVSWDETTSSGTTIRDLTMLGASLATTNCASTGAKTWDVTGTTNGIVQAYADGKTSVTIKLVGVTGTGTTKNTTLMELGDRTTPADGIDLDITGGATPAYIEITYTPAASGAPRRMHRVAVNGQY